MYDDFFYFFIGGGMFEVVAKVTFRSQVWITNSTYFLAALYMFYNKKTLHLCTRPLKYIVFVGQGS